LLSVFDEYVEDLAGRMVASAIRALAAAKLAIYRRRGTPAAAIMSFDHLDVSKAGSARKEKRGAFRTPRRIDN